jgi:hypothetical protein
VLQPELKESSITPRRYLELNVSIGRFSPQMVGQDAGVVSAHCGGGFNFEQAFFTRIPVDETELYPTIGWQRLDASMKSAALARLSFGALGLARSSIWI